MRYLRYLALLSIFLLPATFSHAQVAVGLGVGAPYAYGPPVCSYGYYDYAPYACAPYGYYGSDWFYGGVFIGAGPWFHYGWRGGYPAGFRGGYGYGGYGARGYVGARGYAGGAGFRGGVAAGGYRGGVAAGGFRGGVAAGGFHGGGGASFHGGGGGGFHGGGGGHGGGGRR